jgi:drug/metabolite transporter (DMT)-like permease
MSVLDGIDPPMESADDQPDASNAYVFLILMIVIGSSTATAAKFAVGSLPFGLLMVLRFGVAGLCLLPVTWRGVLRIVRSEPGRLLAAAALCVPVNQTFFLNGTRLAPTTHVALIYATCPLVVLILSTTFGQERFGPGKLLGTLASVAGVLIVALDSFRRPGLLTISDPRGDLLLVGAVASWGAYLTVNKPLVARHGALPVLAATFLIGAMLGLPLAVTTFPGWDSVVSAPRAAWTSLAYLIGIVSVFGLACQNFALRRLNASYVATVGNVAPILTVVWGVWLLGEPLSSGLAVGATLTLGGVVWTGRAPA